VLASGVSEDQFFRVVRSGQGTDMPRFSSEQTADAQVWEILAHLRSLSQAGPSEPVRGNAENGARIFRTSCAGCHRVNGVGGALGPDLSRVGAMRSASGLMAKVRDPNRSRVAGYRPVSVVLSDGRRIRGVIKNEDAFSIQVMDVSERIQGFSKTGVREIVRESRSAMPAFGPDRLSDSDLRDLVSHLMTLRRNNTAAN
jgi:putative heme-binding domain-containing protein